MRCHHCNEYLITTLADEPYCPRCNAPPESAIERDMWKQIAAIYKEGPR